MTFTIEGDKTILEVLGDFDAAVYELYCQLDEDKFNELADRMKITLDEYKERN